LPNKNYERGRASEYKCQRDLEALGYQTVRTAGSHGAADVIGWNTQHMRFVQCKTTTGTPSGGYKEDMMKLNSLLLPPHSQAELWVRKIGLKGWARQEVVMVNGPTSTNAARDGSKDTKMDTERDS
jgi:Holliday junction resolvase